MPLLNPFLYGRPVPPERHIGRQTAIRTLFSRLGNGESTAVVGGPHIGKSSLLRYVQDAEVRTQWFGEAASRYVFTEIDSHMLPRDFTPADFWRQALAVLPHTASDAAVASQWQQTVDSGFDSFTLESLWHLVARSGQRVVLVIDEFDVLLNHPNFSAGFFGALRSMTTRTEGLAVITASRLSVTAMNRLSQQQNPHGSPFFNNITEIPLLPLAPDESRRLIDTTLASTGMVFSPDDHAYIHGLAGHHPFTVQVAAAGMFEAVLAGKSGAARLQAVSQFFHDTTTAYFDDFWQHLSPTEQTAMLLLTLGEMKGRVDGRTFNTNDLGRLEWYGPELARLHRLGMIEQVTQPRSLIGLTLWETTYWRIASRGFVWWATYHVIAESRQEVGFEQWLRDKEYQGLLTREQTERVRDLAKALPTAVKSIEQIGKLLLGDVTGGV